MKSPHGRILNHIKENPKNESSRSMSGFVAALPWPAEEIRQALDQLVADGVIVRYGNGKRHCWKLK